MIKGVREPLEGTISSHPPSRATSTHNLRQVPRLGSQDGFVQQEELTKFADISLAAEKKGVVRGGKHVEDETALPSRDSNGYRLRNPRRVTAPLDASFLLLYDPSFSSFPFALQSRATPFLTSCLLDSVFEKISQLSAKCSARPTFTIARHRGLPRTQTCISAQI